MPITLDALRARRSEILRIAARHGAREVRVFGSVVRGEAHSGSDIDFLVEMEKGRSGFDFIGFLQDLEDALGTPVDVVQAGALHWYMRDRVLAEAVML
jgi:predicted nucleotidyltransferase